MENKLARGNAANIRARLDYPILDSDGRWIESVPVVIDYLGSVAGGDLADRYAATQARRGAWYEASQAERAQPSLESWQLVDYHRQDTGICNPPAAQRKA